VDPREMDSTVPNSSIFGRQVFLPSNQVSAIRQTSLIYYISHIRSEE
jgi:hypothetical protein